MSEHDEMSDWVASLPEASGTFEGTFDQAAYDAIASVFSVPDLMPVEISTGDDPLPAGIAFMTGLTIKAEERSWTLPVDHVELYPGENRAVVWVRRAREGS